MATLSGYEGSVLIPIIGITDGSGADFFDTEPLDAAELKGKAEAVTPYRITGETAVRSRFQAAEARGFTPYTGREEERATLQRCLERAVAGEGQFITVMGEAGVGKSRLLYEFRHAIDREQVTVLGPLPDSWPGNAVSAPAGRPSARAATA